MVASNGSANIWLLHFFPNVARFDTCYWLSIAFLIINVIVIKLSNLISAIE